MTESSYSVGKGKPPTNTQFKKGQSGNPGGKPKSRPAASASMQQRLKEAMEDALLTDWYDLKKGIGWSDADEPMRQLARDIVVRGIEGRREYRLTLLSLMEKLDKLKMNERVHKMVPVSLTEGRAEGKAEGKAEGATSATKNTHTVQLLTRTGPAG
jgi:hypothetical protein